MDINCGMELQFSEASNLTEPDFTTSGTGLTINMESSTDDVRTLLDSVTSTCTSTAYRGHYQSDRHLTAADFKLDLGPANDLVSATDLSMENSVTDISDSMMTSEECSDGYSIVNAALEGNVAPLKPQVITSSNGNAVNLGGIPLATVLSGIQAIPVIPITNLENIQLCSDGKLVNLNELSLVSNDNQLLQNDHKNSLNSVGQSAILLGNVLMLHPGIVTQVDVRGADGVQNKAFVSNVENGPVCQKTAQECSGPTTVENGHAIQNATPGFSGLTTGENSFQKATQDCTEQRTVENENASPQVGQEYTEQRIVENGNASHQVAQEYSEQRIVENRNASLRMGQVGSDNLTSHVTQRLCVGNQSVLNSLSSVQNSFISDSVTSNVDLNIDNTMTLKKSDVEQSLDTIPIDPLEKTKIMTCGKTIYLTFDCKSHNKPAPKTTAVSVNKFNNSLKVSMDTHSNSSGLQRISETRDQFSLSSPVLTPSEHLCRNTQLPLIEKQTAKSTMFPSTQCMPANSNVKSSMGNQTSGSIVLSQPHVPSTSMHVSTSLSSIYSTCSRFPLTTNVKNSLTAVQMLATPTNITTVSTNGLHKPVCSPSLVQRNSDKVAATSVTAASLNKFKSPVETHPNPASGRKEEISHQLSENRTKSTLAVPANQIQVPEATNQTAFPVKVSVSERKLTNQQSFQNNVLRIISTDQPMKNQLMIPVSVSTCQSSSSTNQVSLSTNYVQLPLTVDQVSGLITANKIKVPVSTNQVTVPVPINQTIIPVSTNQVTASVLGSQITVPVSTNQVTAPVLANQIMVPVSTNQITAPVLANQIMVPVSSNQITAPVLANEITVPVSTNQITAPVLGNHITVPVSTNQIVVPLSPGNKTVPISTKLLVANKETVLVSETITAPITATKPVVSGSQVKVSKLTNKLPVPMLPNHLKSPVSGSLVKTPVSSDPACLTTGTPLLVNQLTTLGSTNPSKLNQNSISLNQIRFPVSNQLSVPVANQLSIPVSNQFVIPVNPNFSTAEENLKVDQNLTNKTALKSSPQYKPTIGTRILSNKSSADTKNTTSSPAIPTKIVSHTVNDNVVDPATISKKSTVLSSVFHCSQVQSSPIPIMDRPAQINALITDQSKQTKTGKTAINNKSVDMNDNQSQSGSSSDQLQNQQKCTKDNAVNIESFVNQGKITLPLSSELVSDLKQDNQELIFVPQAENSNYISILGTVKKQKLSTAESPVMLRVKKVESQNPKSGHADCNETNEEERLSSSVVNFLSGNIDGVIDQQNLDTHLVLLDDPKPFKCDLCSAAFNRMGNYTRHRMIHTVNTKDSYRYKCEECGRLFLQRCDMKRHMLIHSNQEPYRCQECGKGYIRRSDLVVHTRFHRKERAFKCGRCGKEFFQSGDLNRHIRHVHLQSSLLTCGHCNRQFAKEATLIRHIQMKHRDIIIKSLKKTNVNKDSDSKETHVEDIKEDESMDYDASRTVNTDVT